MPRPVAPRLVRAALPAFAFVATLLPSRPAATEPEPVLALVHARILDGTGAVPVPDGTVVIRGERIAAAGPAAKVAVPTGARVLDLQGAALLPGLVNAHVHGAYDADQLRAWARAGVTTVRDEGPFDAAIARRIASTGGAPTLSTLVATPGFFDPGFLKKRAAFAADPALATIVAATPIITVTDGYGWAFADTPEAARSLVQAYLDLGVDVVKTSLESEQNRHEFELPTREQFAAVVEAAHARGKKVSVHATWSWALAWAVEAGADDVAHMVVDSVEDALLAKMVAKGVAWVPTLELWKCVSAQHRLEWDRTAMRNLARFHQAGGIVAMGTDFAGFACEFDAGLSLTELLAMQEAGLSPMDVIVASTRNAARASDREQELGTIGPGKRADLLAVRGDPLRDLRALAAPVLVVHRGVVIRDERAGGGP